MYLHEIKILKQIAEKLKSKFPDRIASIYAFGSRVRGDYDERSDFDVLIVVKNRTPEIEMEIMDILVDNEIENGMSFAPVMKDLESYESEKKFNTPFSSNVLKDGIEL